MEDNFVTEFSEELLLQKIAVGTRAQLLKRAENMLANGGMIATVNPIMLCEAMKNEKLAEALYNSLNIPDGVGIKRELAKRGVHTEVYPGVELVKDIIGYKKITVGAIGAAPGVAEKALKNLRHEHRGMIPLFAFDGYHYKEEDLKRVIAEKKPQLVMVCLGVPKQQILMNELRQFSEKTLFIGLGGALDVFSGKIKRAPLFFRSNGIEWLYRIATQPHRLKGIPKIFDFLYLCRQERKRFLNRWARGNGKDN